MRLKICLAILALSAFSGAQVWEKRLAPGLVYREEVNSSVPRIVHVLRWSLGTPVIHAGADLGSGKVFDQTPLKGRDTVSRIVERNEAVAGVNGDFFQVPYTGDPLGLMVRNGELISVPIVRRPVLAWMGDKPQIGFADWKGEVSLESGDPLAIDGFNEASENNRLTLSTESVGFAVGKAPDLVWIIKLDEGVWTPNCARTGEIVEIVRDLAGRKLAPGMAAVVATGSKIETVAGAKIGQHVKITFRTEGFDWKDVQYAVGGGPTLIREGKIDVPWKEQRFKDAFATQRHPRTAVGLSANGDVILVAIDGRQPGISDGATLSELAQIMLRLGCTEAMNLDGGGSTCLVVHGSCLNRPSDGKERPVANAILLFEQQLPVDPEAPVANPTLAVKTPDKVFAQTTVNLELLDGKAPIRNAEILWSATGAGWIDQGGTLHAIRAGDCAVTAWSHGCAVTVTIHVVAKPVAKVQAHRPKAA